MVYGWRAIEQVGNQWRRHVVRKIGNDMPFGRTRNKWTPIQMHRIGVNYFNVWQVFYNIAQHFDNTIVNFNGHDVRTRFGESQRERTKTCANFKNVIIGAYVCEASNLAHGIWVDKKVLAKCSPRCETVLRKQLRNVVV
jgi:hypothetical protein